MACRVVFSHTKSYKGYKSRVDCFVDDDFQETNHQPFIHVVKTIAYFIRCAREKDALQQA